MTRPLERGEHLLGHLAAALPAVVDDDAVAVRGEGPGHGRTDATGGAGDEDPAGAGRVAHRGGPLVGCLVGHRVTLAVPDFPTAGEEG